MKLKYPVLMVHGMGFRDYKLVGYWGRIPDELGKLGCNIYFGEQDSNADIDTNGRHIARRIEEILGETGADKVNIIAHSKGGLDSRYAISSLGMADRVASLVTVSTPHNGSRTVDFLMRFPDPLIRFVGFCTDCWFRVLGDKKPNTYSVFHSFTTKGAAEFNEQTPDCDGVLYQSYATVMKKPSSDMLMWFTNAVVGCIEGENDGLLTPESVKWGEFKGVYRGAGRRGISHCDQIDLRRRALCEKEGEGLADIVDLYKTIVRELYDRGL
ncbi:MAG: hypothetical protein IJB57_11605 [Clostridia bacterium]|nr:hypothetical protein [Clostridia bacterium]